MALWHLLNVWIAIQCLCLWEVVFKQTSSDLSKMNFERRIFSSIFRARRSSCGTRSRPTWRRRSTSWRKTRTTLTSLPDYGSKHQGFYNYFFCLSPVRQMERRVYDVIDQMLAPSQWLFKDCSALVYAKYDVQNKPQLCALKPKWHF